MNEKRAINLEALRFLASGQDNLHSVAITQCIAEIERLQKDAERYRWLRDSKNAYPLFFIAQRDPNNIVVQFTGDLADANIDEMMKTQNLNHDRWPIE